MTGARLKHYGWGREGEGMSEAERKFVLSRYSAKFGAAAFDTVAVARLEDLDLRDGRPTEAALRALVASPHRAALKTFRARGVLVVEDRVRYLSEHRPLRRALLERFGEQALDFRTRYPWWKGQSWTDRALAHTPLS